MVQLVPSFHNDILGALVDLLLTVASCLSVLPKEGLPSRLFTRRAKEAALQRIHDALTSFGKRCESFPSLDVDGNHIRKRNALLLLHQNNNLFFIWPSVVKSFIKRLVSRGNRLRSSW